MARTTGLRPDGPNGLPVTVAGPLAGPLAGKLPWLAGGSPSPETILYFGEPLEDMAWASNDMGWMPARAGIKLCWKHMPS